MKAPRDNQETQELFRHKVGLAEMLKGGVIMDVTNADQAKIAEEAGAVAVMALERIPSDIRKTGGIARMSQPGMIKEIPSVVDGEVVPRKVMACSATFDHHFIDGKHAAVMSRVIHECFDDPEHFFGPIEA